MSELNIIYKLAELPSAHHRAGLAGLVMMVNWLKRIQPNHRGICDIKFDTTKATFTIDQEGLKALLLEHFADGGVYKWEDKLKTKSYKTILNKLKDEKDKRKNILENLFFSKENSRLFLFVCQQKISYLTILFYYLSSQTRNLPKYWLYLLKEQILFLTFLSSYISLIEYISNGKIRPLEERINQETNKRQYKYEDFAAKFSIINDLDPTQDKLWHDLWRDFYQKLYKQPATRTAFLDYEPSCIFRLDLKEASDKSREKIVKDNWKQLDQNINLELKGYKFLGSAKHNAELIPFQDTGKTDFLLNFWIYAVQIYVPIYRKLENKKYKPAKAGYAVVIPDIVDLENFCEDFPEALRESRGEHKKAHYFFKSIPKQAIINLAPAAGLDFLHALRKQLAKKSRDIEDTVTAVEVYLLDSNKNQYWIEDLARIYPDSDSENEFIRVRKVCRDDTFITQRLRNILDENQWHFGFDRLCASTKNIDLIFGKDSKFCHDARKSFITEVTDLNQSSEQRQEEQLSLEAMIYKIVEVYVKKKLKQKYDLEWDKNWKPTNKDNEEQKEEEEGKKNPHQDKIDNYNEKKRKIALDAFYDCRSRSSMKFCDFFAATFGSVSQGFILNNQASYEKLAKALFEETDKIKSLTLLALAANS